MGQESQDRQPIGGLMLLLQVGDSAFPVGGFAHSGGLESALKWQTIQDEADFCRFVHDSLLQVTDGSLPFVRRGYDGAKEDGAKEEVEWAKIDRECDAFLNNHVANRASRRQGRALLNTATMAFPQAEFAAWQKRVREAELPCHLAPVFGRFAATLRISPTDADQLFLFMTLRNVISSAVRLGIIGPLRGQAIQYECLPQIDSLLASRQDRQQAPHQTAPLIDLLQSTHDRVYSRLFQS